MTWLLLFLYSRRCSPVHAGHGTEAGRGSSASLPAVPCRPDSATYCCHPTPRAMFPTGKSFSNNTKNNTANPSPSFVADRGGSAPSRKMPLSALQRTGTLSLSEQRQTRFSGALQDLRQEPPRPVNHAAKANRVTGVRTVATLCSDGKRTASARPTSARTNTALSTNATWRH